MKKKLKVFMAIPSTGQRDDVQIYLFRDLQERYGDRIEMVFPENCVFRIFHDFARCELADEFMRSDCDVLWFLDSDVAPPKFIFDLIDLHWDKWKVAGAPYPLWMPSPGGDELTVLFTAYKGVTEAGLEADLKQRGIVMSEVPQSGTDWVDALATGCMFIKREVFEKMPKPWFEFKFDHTTRKIKEGEDLGFCLKLHDLGIKCFIDYGMVCKHYKRVCLLDVNNYAISMSNAKVLSYDHEVRMKVSDSIKAAYEQGKRDAMKANPKPSQTGLILPKSLAQ